MSDDDSLLKSLDEATRNRITWTQTALQTLDDYLSGEKKDDVITWWQQNDGSVESSKFKPIVYMSGFCTAVGVGCLTDSVVTALLTGVVGPAMYGAVLALSGRFSAPRVMRYLDYPSYKQMTEKFVASGSELKTGSIYASVEERNGLWDEAITNLEDTVKRMEKALKLK